MASASDQSIGQEHHVVDVEKGNGLHRTTTMVTMPPEMFEKVSLTTRNGSSLNVNTTNHTVTTQFYLTPKAPVVGDANKRYANPTALGLVG